MVTSQYFEAVGTRLVDGRTFTTDEDLEERQRVVIISEKLAARVAPDGRAVGATVGIPLDGRAVQARVVGIVEEVRNDDLGTPGRGAVYVPYRQEASRDISFVVRTQGDPEVVAPLVQRAVLDVEPRLALYGMAHLSRYLDAELRVTRFGLALLMGYSALGLLAAAMGLFSVVAWEVARRRREFGVRLAVGATAAQVQWATLAVGLKLAALGTILGALLAALSLGELSRILYGVTVADPQTWGAAVGLVTSVTLLACWSPAYRAAQLDPASTLRSD